MTADGRYLAELERAEAKLLSSRDSHEVIAGRIGSSPDIVRSYCNHLVQRSRLGRCTHVQNGSGKSGQQPSSDPYRQQEDLPQYQGQQYPARQQPFGYQQPYGQQPPRDPYGRPDPGRWQGQPPWQDQAYQGQPSYPPQQSYGQPSQPSFTTDPQYGPPPGQPAYQQQAQYPGTPRKQAYPQAPPRHYDLGAWPQADHRKRSRSLVYGGIAALIVIAGGGAAYALVGHGTGSASVAQPLTCKQQYDAWKTGPARAQVKQLDADLSMVSAAGSAEDITALTSGMKTAGADATTLEQNPMPACADPGGYWEQMLARIKAAGDNAGSASGLGGILLAEAPLKQVPGLEQKLSAELKQAAITPKS